jgi:glycosyltransferase involved in cell wall biosynthesis
MSTRRIHQLMAALSYGDAVSHHALAIQSALRRAGYESEIFVEHVHPRMTSHVRPFWEYPGVSARENVCLFHFSIGSATGALIHQLPDQVVTIYHNVTPAEYFLGYRPHLVGLTYHGRRQLTAFADRSVLGLADSEFNRRELEAAGYRRTAVFPILPDWSAYERPGSRLTRALYADGRTNILFVGRISPNKRIEDLIRVFAYYQRYLEPHSRLLLVGDHRGYEKYYDRLQDMVQALRLEEVVFTGHVDEDDLVAYYRLGHLFLCLSDHEGYCVPLLEAMAVGLPVVAYDAGAVAGTLAGGGVLLSQKAPAEVAELVAEILANADLRGRILATQARVMRELKAIDYSKLLLQHLEPVLA